MAGRVRNADCLKCDEGMGEEDNIARYVSQVGHSSDFSETQPNFPDISVYIRAEESW